MRYQLEGLVCSRTTELVKVREVESDDITWRKPSNVASITCKNVKLSL
jgi:hypothetical protein